MRVIVIGATGTVGRLAVKEILSEGHQVTAFARSPERLDIRHQNLKLVRGNAMSEEEVAAAIEGQDGVVVTLGSGISRKSTVRSEGTMNVIKGMQQHGVSRLVCQSTLGTYETWSNLNFFWKRIMFGLLIKPVFLDHELQEKLVRASGLDWTIVRPSAFADGPASESFNVDFAPTMRNLTLKITRSDVARFLVKQLSDLRYLRRAVSISN